MNSYAHEARKGASAISRGAERSPFQVVYDLVETTPGMDEKQRFEVFRELLAKDPGCQRAVDFYCFKNAHDYATTSRSRKPSHERSHIVQRQENVRVAAIHQQITLLELTMPNGKLMKACTGQEMATFGSRFQKIAERVGKNKFVGSVLDEAQVKAIMQ